MRQLVWLGDTQENIRSFPIEIRKDIGSSLFEVQKGDTPSDAKPLKGLGGVFEIVAQFDGETYRAVYTVKIGEVIYILHVFQKKSKHGIKTPQRDIELIKRRYQQALNLEERSRE